MSDINSVADYIIFKANEEGDAVTVLKLQKLLYYVQAWSLAIRDEKAFDENFEAWVHGPVSRKIYNRFKTTHTIYDTLENVKIDEIVLSEDIKCHIDEVLETYLPFSGIELEDMTHQELPWLRARQGLPLSSRCTREIGDDDMRKYYGELADNFDVLKGF